MLAIIADNQYVYIQQITQAEESIIDKEFSVAHPNARYIDTSLGYFDGVYHKYNKKHQRLSRALLPMLRRICEKRGLPLHVVDNRPPPKYSPPPESAVAPDLLAGITLDQHQIDAIKAACKHEVGLIAIPTGGGKCITGESHIYINNISIAINKIFNDINAEQYLDIHGSGLQVLGPNGYTDILGLYKTNKRPIKAIKLASGKKLRGVYEHRVYTNNGWRQLQEIKVGEFIQIYSGGGTEAGDKRSINMEASEEVWAAQWQNEGRSAYQVILCQLSRADCSENSQDIHQISREIWQTSVQALHRVNERKGADAFPSYESPKQTTPSEQAELHEGPQCYIKSYANLHCKIWTGCPSQLFMGGRISGQSKNASYEVKEQYNSILTDSNPEIQADYVIKERGGDEENKKIKARNLEKESLDSEIHKRIIYASANNTDEAGTNAVWLSTLPEQARIGIHSCLREIGGYIRRQKGADNQVRQLVVYFGLHNNNGHKKNDNRNQIEISIRDEEGRDITEEVSGRNLCGQEFNDLSSSRVHAAKRDGFYSDAFGYEQVVCIHEDDAEYCYDLQVADQSHAYWTNNILSHNTEMMAGIAKLYQCPTVILCDMTTVVDQIKNRLELRDVAGEIGMFYAGKRPNGQLVIVGSVQSLIIPTKIPSKTKRDTPQSYNRKIKAYETRRRNARKLREIIGKCDLLMVDECDNATGPQWRNLFKFWYKGRRKFGFSGTPFDPDKPVKNITLKEFLGSIIYTTDRKHLEEINRIIPFRYTAIAFGDEKLAQDKTAFDIAVKETLIENPAFHEIVRDIAIKATSKAPQHGVMILVESKPLGYALESAIPGSAFICGDHNMHRRKEVIKDFEDRKIKVLIGGKIARRGLDLKGGCETLILATGGKLSSEVNQKIGRAVRLNSRGSAQIYDFFFLCNYYLYAHSRRRLKTIVALGYPAKVVFKYGVVDAEKFVKSRFRRPRLK